VCDVLRLGSLRLDRVLSIVQASASGAVRRPQFSFSDRSKIALTRHS